MENLDELHLEVEKRSNINNTNLVVSVLWTIIAEQPLHVQFRLIKQGLDKHKPLKICKHEKCPNHECIKVQTLPTHNIEHTTPHSVPHTQRKRLKWFSWLIGTFFN